MSGGAPRRPETAGGAKKKTAAVAVADILPQGGRESMTAMRGVHRGEPALNAAGAARRPTRGRDRAFPGCTPATTLP
jgi:hypothetical protein